MVILLKIPSIFTWMSFSQTLHWPKCSLQAQFFHVTWFGRPVSLCWLHDMFWVCFYLHCYTMLICYLSVMFFHALSNECVLLGERCFLFRTLSVCHMHFCELSVVEFRVHNHMSTVFLYVFSLFLWSKSVLRILCSSLLPVFVSNTCAFHFLTNFSQLKNHYLEKN